MRTEKQERRHKELLRDYQWGGDPVFTHPELQPGEKYIFNILPAGREKYESEEYDSVVRVGVDSYTVGGTPVSSYLPVFLVDID